MGKRDKRRVKSQVISYIRGEAPGARHARRLAFNLQAEEWVREQAIASGLTLTVANDGHHWQFRGDGHKFKADWWPSSAKLVLNAKYGNGIHVHDYEAAMNEIRKGLHAFGKIDPRRDKRLVKKYDKRINDNLREQIEHGVNINLRISGRPKRKSVKPHHCFHCNEDKPLTQFRGAGCTWCKQCEAQ